MDEADFHRAYITQHVPINIISLYIVSFLRFDMSTKHLATSTFLKQHKTIKCKKRRVTLSGFDVNSGSAFYFTIVPLVRLVR